MPERESASEGEWEYVPIAVLGIVCVSFLFTLIGARPRLAPGGSPAAFMLNATQTYVLNMFMHAGLLHFLANMFLLVLFGGALTMLSSNRHVLYVAFTSHVLASIWLDVGRGLLGIGSSLAVAGIIAATIVRAAAAVVGTGTDNPIDRLLGGTLALLVLSLFGLLSLTGMLYLPIFDHHFGGWVFGALAELGWLWRHRRQ